jgi:hypothetical protein
MPLPVTRAESGNFQKTILIKPKSNFNEKSIFAKSAHFTPFNHFW